LKLSLEVKTALLVILGIIFFFFGFSYLKGNNVLDSSRTYYAEYSNVEGLTASTPVTINGLNVGKVTDISFKEDNSGKIMVTLRVDTDFKFSKNSIAQIYDNGLIGGKALAILPAFDSAEEAQNGDHLKSATKAGLTDLMQQKLTPLQEKIEGVMVSADSLLVNLNSVLDNETKQNLKSGIAGLSETMSNFKKTSKVLDDMLVTNKLKIDTTLDNVENASGNFASITSDLEKVDVAKTVTELQATLNKFNSVLASVDNGEGSIGKLLKDEGLYNNLEGASKQMEQLLEDMKLNPKRYVHFSLFGKKAKRYDAEGNEIKDKN